MVTTKRRLALCVALGPYALVLGFLRGVVVERMRLDTRRAAVLRQYDDSLRRWHAVLMEIEKERSGRASSNGSSSVLLGRKSEHQG